MAPSSSDWRYGPPVLWALLLVLSAHTLLRAFGLYGPPAYRSLIMASFLLLWPTPWLLLPKAERAAIGLGQAKGPTWLLRAVMVGLAAACVVFWTSYFLYGLGPDHAYSSVRDSFLSGRVPDLSRFALFWLFAVPGVIFSPIGEEFFCRGVIARIGERRYGFWFGASASALVFAALHVMHHGLVHDAAGWRYLGAPALVWSAEMIAVSFLFSAMRKLSGSIWMAVAAHAGFNLGMIAIIFSLFVQ